MVRATRKEDGTFAIEFKSWHVPILIFILTFSSQFIVKVINAGASQTEINRSVEKRLTGLEEAEKTQVPADQLVKKETFQAVVESMKKDIQNINDNVNWLVRKQGKEPK